MYTADRRVERTKSLREKAADCSRQYVARPGGCQRGIASRSDPQRATRRSDNGWAAFEDNDRLPQIGKFGRDAPRLALDLVRLALRQPRHFPRMRCNNRRVANLLPPPLDTGQPVQTVRVNQEWQRLPQDRLARGGRCGATESELGSATRLANAE